MDKRTIARELTMQAVCQLDVQGENALATLEKFFADNSDDTLVLKLAKMWTEGLWQHISECDELISDSAIKWGLARLSLIDRSILRLGAYQLKYCADMPAKVVINEAIEMAKKFSAQSSPGFVNGVLDAIHKKLKNSESKNENA